MKKFTIVSIIVLTLGCFTFSFAKTDAEEVEKVSMSYIEGFYEGNTDKLKNCLDPKLNKFGFWKNKDSGEYASAGSMSFDAALKYAQRVKDKKNFPKADALKKVEVIDVLDKIAITKVSAWWGIDYMLLAKNEGKWMIRQIVWEGPLPTASPSNADKLAVKNAGLGYIEGFYEGDTNKLKNSLRPTLFKWGYSYDRKASKYKKGKQMTYQKALDFTKWVVENNKYANKDAPKKVEVLDVMNHIAAIKVTAYWGIDYMLLSKEGDKWMIEQVLWAGHPSKK